MAVPSNRSPSPLSSRPIPPHSRNTSDSNSATRRSFSGNPFPRPSVLTNPRSLNPITPANSPAGFGRRNSLGCDEKENEKDQNLKPVKAAAKSPANGSKNFMSPTISAASKFTPSPRKKILVETNDPVRTSISLSEGKASFFCEISSEIKDDLGTKSELAVDHQNGDGKDVVLEGSRSSKASKRVTFLEVPTDNENGTEVIPETTTIVDSSSKNMPSCFPVSPIIAPLDADPSLPPYDPKTNYLSPRPQFLHYKPNPRIEVLLNKEKVLDLGEAKRLVLEVSENFSDSDGTEGSDPEYSQKDSEHSSSAENALSEAEAEEVHVHEESTITDPITHDSSEGIVEGKEEEQTLNIPISHDMCEGIAEEKDEARTINAPTSYELSDEVVYDIGQAKPMFFTKLKSVSLLLVILIACISFWPPDSPMMDSSSVLNVVKSSKLREPLAYAVLAKANFSGFGERFKQLSFNTISHLSLLTSHLGRGDNLGAMKFMNLTDLKSDMLVCGCLEGNQQSQTFIRDPKEDDLEEQEDAVTEPFEEQTFAEVFSDDIYEKESEEVSALETDELPPAPAQLAEMNELESSETLRNQDEASSHVDTELKCKLRHEASLAPVSEAPKVKSESELYQINPEVIEIGNFELDISLDSGTKVESSSADTNHESTSDTFSKIVEDRSSVSEAPKVKSESELYQINPEVIEIGNFELDISLDSGTKVESSSADTNHESTSDTFSKIVEDRSSETAEFSIGGSENKFSTYSIMGIASLVLALGSAAAFVYLKQGNSSNPNLVVDTDELPSKKINPVASVPKRMFQERAYSKATDDVEDESCPSEMSSFERSSSYGKKDLRGANEAQSQERKPRKYSKRESLASSSDFSSDSPSYGSFTTYERISSKHANGDDEVMTPVRRSSRLRYHVTCP